MQVIYIFKKELEKEKI